MDIKIKTVDNENIEFDNHAELIIDNYDSKININSYIYNNLRIHSTYTDADGEYEIVSMKLKVRKTD